MGEAQAERPAYRRAIGLAKLRYTQYRKGDAATDLLRFLGREMSEADQRWGARLRQAQLDAGLSQKVLGIEAGLDEFVASTRINRYELGVHRPDLLTVRNLGRALGVPVAYFYADEDDELAALLLAYGKAPADVRAQAQILLEIKLSI